MPTMEAHPVTATGIIVAPLEEGDVSAADVVFRLAFGTALGLPEPGRFAEGAALVRTRWLADPTCAFKAELNGDLVGCAFVTRWGSYGLLGPLAVHPDHWGRGVGRLLWEARLPLLEHWGATHAALFTRAEPKNLHLYQKFGFWPGSLTALTAKRIDTAPAPGGPVLWHTFADSSAGSRENALAECRRLTDMLHPGLDLTREIAALDVQGLGDTLLIDDGDGLSGFAVCHVGTGSEAGPDACYVKFAAVMPGERALRRFERLLDVCEGYAAARGMTRLAASVNTARREAYRGLLQRGYDPFAFGVAMHRPDEPAYDRPGVYVVDDRR
jgi:GNAT superfamily N-acetyltransferase